MFFVLNRQRFFDIKIECALCDIFLYFLQLAKEENFDEYMRKELWIKENFNEWKREKEEEMKAKLAESARYKSFRRYMKKGGPGQMSFGPE